MTEQLTGDDVSRWQGHIDWTQAVPQIGFAMLKASQGTSEVDPQYATNIAALRAAGERRGSYHYADGADPILEADHYVAAAGRHNGEMQALDFEGAMLGHPDPVGWAAAWLHRVIARTDNRPLIYMSGSTVTRFDWSRVIALDVGLWVASWDTAPVHQIGHWPFAIMWQRDDHGTLRGVSGNVDEDVFFGNGDVWAKYANNIDATPAPHPAPAPAPHPTPAPAPAPAHGHVVVAGDTLTAIAHAAHTTVAQLVALNEHAYPSLAHNPDYIQIGWHITLPGAPAPVPAQHRVHHVVAGDTLSGIADAAHATVDQLLHLNPQITNPDHIEVGWTITLP
jgi:GH25 family lysozyme M1 (1,4-beta-N-acetylmuramidase)/LysM repeat protein